MPAKGLLERKIALPALSPAEVFIYPPVTLSSMKSIAFEMTSLAWRESPDT